ncbi:MAG: hypothetical protein GY928_29415, partial [Colwellia sp.]|nr:hypothetical protein [Colwellia sp.]
IQVSAAPAMVVKQFEWKPAIVETGKPTTFYWNVENAQSCFGNNKTRTTAGNNGVHIYNDPLAHVTKWYCNDKYGNRFPADESKYIEAPLTVKAPAMVVKQFEWLPNKVVVGQETSFHWNVENADSCFGNNKTRTASGNNGVHRFTEPKTHTTQWFCNDKYGNRLPADDTKFIEAPLQVDAAPVVYQTDANNLYLHLPSQLGAKYIKISRDTGTWVVTELELTTTEWAAIKANLTVTDYVVEIGEFSGGDSLEDIKLTNSVTNKEIIIEKTVAGYQTAKKPQKIIYIHTDLLGSPVAETDVNGDVL